MTNHIEPFEVEVTLGTLASVIYLSGLDSEVAGSIPTQAVVYNDFHLKI